MNVKLNSTLVHLLVICILLGTGNEGRCQTPKETLNDEPPLNLESFFKTADQIRDQKSMFYERFKFTSKNGNVDIADTFESLKMKALLTLHKEARDAASVCQDSSSKKKYVTGLKIHYGKTGNKVDFFYEPIYMCGETRNKEFIGTVTETGKVYAYNVVTSTFDPHPTTKADYVSSIRINRFLDRSLKPKRFERMYQLQQPGATNWKRDSESIIFSFQEIFDFYHLVNQDETDANRYERTLMIENGAANYRRKRGNFLQYWRSKHTIFITSKDSRTNKIRALGRTGVNSTAKGDGANLGHLCPPSCNEVRYPTDTL